MKPHAEYPLRIYYDASCPLCRAEMQGLKTRDHAGALELVDCSGEGFADPDLQQAGIPVARAMERIHARDARGNWFDGVEVFSLAYGAAGMKRTARILANPVLRPVLEWFYPIIARNRKWFTRLGFAPFLTKALHRKG